MLQEFIYLQLVRHLPDNYRTDVRSQPCPRDRDSHPSC